MDDIAKRLNEATEKCIKCYESWRGEQKDATTRETLNESLHEVRRAAAALEIEMIRIDRTAAGVRNIPTPGHRAMRRHDGDNGDEATGTSSGDDIGNRGEPPQGQGGGPGGGMNMARHMRRRPGGGGHRGGHSSREG